MPPAVLAQLLTKVYTVAEREAGQAASMRSPVRRRTEDVRAVDGISFELAPGEVVGFLGRNGAGKTTTPKMLSGLLRPTDGRLSVLGFTPSKRDQAYLRQITLVMGQRAQLLVDARGAASAGCVHPYSEGEPRQEPFSMLHRDRSHCMLTLGEVYPPTAASGGATGCSHGTSAQQRGSTREGSSVVFPGIVRQTPA
jgi:hypothetical protein